MLLSKTIHRLTRSGVNSTLFLALTTLLALPATAKDKQKAKETDLKTVLAEIAEGKAVLIDVREKREWDAGHLADATFLPLSGLVEGTITAETLAGKLPKEKVIYTHCKSGVRSFNAAEILQKHGYEVRPLAEGYQDLLDAGFKQAD